MDRKSKEKKNPAKVSVKDLKVLKEQAGKVKGGMAGPPGV